MKFNNDNFMFYTDLQNDKFIFYTDLQFEIDIRVLFECLSAHNRHYTEIFAPMRGGLVPAVYLSHAFNCSLYPIQMLDTKERQMNLDTLVCAETAVGNRIILVDD